MPILDQDPIDNLKDSTRIQSGWDLILTELGLNSIKPKAIVSWHMLVLSANVRRAIKMNGYGRLSTLVMCLDQLFASKLHNNSNLRTKLPKKLQTSLFLSFYTEKICTSSYFSKFGTNSLKVISHGHLYSSPLGNDPLTSMWLTILFYTIHYCPSYLFPNSMFIYQWKNLPQ